VPTAPAADQRRLLEVQALDTRLAQIAHQRTTHPLHETLAEARRRLEDVDSALVTSRTALGDLRRELTKAEADVEQVRSRAARNQQRLDSGAVGAKDAQALVSELESLARRQAELEEVELEVMERLEAHEQAVAELTSAREQQSAEVDRLTAELADATAELDRQAAQTQEQRAAKAEGLDAGLVQTYERLRSQLGQGVAALRGRRCEGCRLELNTTDLNRIAAAAEDEVVRCEECGRILVRGAEVTA